MCPRLFSLILAVSFLASGCHASRVKREDNSYSLAVAAAKDLVSKFGEVPRSAYLQSLEARLGNAINSKSNIFENTPRIIVLKSSEKFAYSPGGGFVLLSEGLINRLNVEAELAFVVAHELAHQELGHTGVDHDFIKEPKLKDLELKADRRGVGIIALSGFDPRAAITALLSSYGRNGDLPFSETHPSLSERVLAIEEAIKESKWTPPGTIDSREHRKFKAFLRQQ